MSDRPTLLFVSPRFLFPVDSGGKIRTTQTLRGLKGGRFRVVLASPATKELVDEHRAAADSICDEFHWWDDARRRRTFPIARVAYGLHRLPIPVRADRSRSAAALVERLIAAGPDVAVFDFLHAVVLAPPVIGCPSVLFTHNVEAEIFARHAQVASDPFRRALWTNQAAKMRRFESEALQRFDLVVAVSDRDANVFRQDYGLSGAAVLPTGVDLDYFRFAPPDDAEHVVFCGSMDWLANQDAVGFFMDEVWGQVAADVPRARMTVIGRSPPVGLMKRAATRGVNWTFTGFVDDVRPYSNGAGVAVIPMRVAGGTRLKVFESMASGTPVVSTAVGVEGLPVVDGRHYLRADDPRAFATAVVRLMRDDALRTSIASEARAYVESRFSFRVAAQAFEDACVRAMELHQATACRRSR